MFTYELTPQLVTPTVNNTGLDSTSMAIASDAVYTAYGPTQDKLQQAQGKVTWAVAIDHT